MAILIACVLVKANRLQLHARPEQLVVERKKMKRKQSRNLGLMNSNGKSCPLALTFFCWARTEKGDKDAIGEEYYCYVWEAD